MTPGHSAPNPLWAPTLTIRRLGIVSRDYRFEEKNGYSDFSQAFPAILRRLDALGCDAVLFALYTLVQRRSFQVAPVLGDLKLQRLRSVWVEEFREVFSRKTPQRSRTPVRFVVHYRAAGKWHRYVLKQRFGALKSTRKFARETLAPFLRETRDRRRIGNALVLICGESNIVKYSPTSQRIEDPFGFLDAMPKEVQILLNPIHDRMTRFEMKLKRRFLSQQGRWVVSVWNKGKVDRKGKVRDGRRPPWTVFHDGEAFEPMRLDAACIETRSPIEMAILDLGECGFNAVK